ncbi:PIN domain-containing protein [Pseudomonas syringae group genomosp. 3]|uniref:PIN domain-containing protein n=1 Tax=Pseudomonas syringae group genomosp. 3 TaxID=251701 RepID=UPI00217F32D6|nr:PIN domain-containing protein [Pseudomonas syringae group genomosp. 3]
MRHSPFTAFYDANVLYPAPLRDFLMHLALTGVYRARWSSQIHDEWKRNLLINRPELTREQLDRTSALMDKAVPDGLVSDYQSLIEGLKLPDADDRHVLVAAIKCNASVIVTFNLKDFPKDVLDTFDMEPLHLGMMAYARVLGALDCELSVIPAAMPTLDEIQGVFD